MQAASGLRYLGRDEPAHFSQLDAAETERSFDPEIITNEKDDEPQVSAWVRAAGGTTVEHVPTTLQWPIDIFSLSHVAVPVPPDDPVYGEIRPVKRDGRIWLGHAALYGEREMLLVPETALLRVRYNPFFPWMTQRITAFLDTPVSATR